MAKANPFRRKTVETANPMVKSNKPADKHPPRTLAAASRQASDRVRIDANDTDLDRGYKRSLESGAFSKRKPPLKEEKTKTVESLEQKMAKSEPPDVWNRIKRASEAAEEKQKAAFLKSRGGKDKK